MGRTRQNEDIELNGTETGCGSESKKGIKRKKERKREKDALAITIAASVNGNWKRSLEIV